MRFSEILAASLLAPLVAAHGGIPGAPKIVGLSAEDAAAVKARSVRYPAKAAHSEHGSQLKARQGGQDGRCGASFGCATCAEGYCCSSGGYCGQGQDYCQAPDSQFEYGPAADANVLPPGGSTRSIARPKVGNVIYGGEGIWVCEKPGQVAITYDDGPYTTTTKVLDLFASYGFKATFFLTGINLYKGRIDDSSKPWASMITRMLSEGHQIASHTWSHQDLSVITKEQRYEQMVRLEMSLSNIIGKFPTYMRPPYSSCTAASGCEQDMADLGYHISYFDLDTDDYNNITPELQQNAKDRVFAALNPSNAATDEFLAIAHDIHYQTAYNLTGYMLDLMVKKGYKGVTMGECLNDPEANWYRSPTGRTATSSVFTPPACASTRPSSATRSASASRTSSGAVSTPTTVSPDSSCGAASGFTCTGFSVDGVLNECCSQYNYCGNTEGHCGTGCQAGFGKCGAGASSSAVSSVARSSSASSSRAASSSAVRSSSSVRASSTAASSVRVSSASSAPSSTPSRAVSQDGSCGGTNGYTCVGFAEGECCSSYGWCGNTAGHCGTGCNPLFGKCTSSGASSSVRPASSSSARASSSTVQPVSSTPRAASSTPRASSVRASSTRVSSSTARPTGVVSPDGSCGAAKGYHCLGFSQGQCCSQYGWCGSSTGHCGTGCNKAYGNCT